MKMETLEAFTLNNNTTDNDKLRIVSWKFPRDKTTMELFIKRLTRNNPQWEIGSIDGVGFEMKNPKTGTIVEFAGIVGLIVWRD